MDYRLKLTMSQSGRSSKDTHSVVFRVAPTGAFSKPAAKQLSLDLAGALANVMFNATNILRASFTQLDENSRAVPHGGYSVGLNVQGETAFGVGDGAMAEQVCLAIEKSADIPKNGVTYLRHCISADEYAAYLNDGTIPARFAAAAAGGYGVGNSLEENILQALEDNNFQMKLPPVTIGGVVTARIVDTIAAQDFRIIKVTKVRRTASSQIADGVQRQLRAWARQAWRMWNRYTAGNHPANVLTAIAAIIASAWELYNSLEAAERILVQPPVYPALPGA